MNNYYRKFKEGETCWCGKSKPAGRSKCKDCQKANAQKFLEKKHKAKADGMCNDCFKKPPQSSFTKCSECLEKRRLGMIKTNKKLKKDVITAYGGKCECCGETRIEFLTIDHVNGDGAEHRRKYRGNIYRWYRIHGYPTGFQVLCMNCNLSKGLYGYCPHQKESNTDWVI